MRDAIPVQTRWGRFRADPKDVGPWVRPSFDPCVWAAGVTVRIAGCSKRITAFFGKAPSSKARPVFDEEANQWYWEEP